MSENKDLLGIKVWNVSKEHNITQTAVQEVLRSFVNVCKDTLKSGCIVRLGTLVTITPSTVSSAYVPTLGYLCKRVSILGGVSYFTVYAIISAYLSSVEDDILSGRNVDIRKLVSFHSILLDDTRYKVNCFMSASLRAELRELEAPLSARVSLNKMLRSRIKEGVA